MRWESVTGGARTRRGRRSDGKTACEPCIVCLSTPSKSPRQKLLLRQPRPRIAQLFRDECPVKRSPQALLLVSVFLPKPPFVGVLTLVGRSRTLAAARSPEVDPRIGLIFYRFQRGPRSRRPLSGRSRRRGGPGGLTLQVLQIPGVGRGSRCRTRCRPADGRTFLRRSFGRGTLDLECVVLLRQAARADPHQYDRNRQPKSHL